MTTSRWGIIVVSHDQSAVGPTRKGFDRMLDLGPVRDRRRNKLDREHCRGPFRGATKVLVSRCRGVGDESGTGEWRRDLLEQRQPFADDPRFVVQHAGEIAAGPRQAADIASADRIGDVDEHDRDRPGRPLQFGGDRG
jgi:hypothetical protein